MTAFASDAATGPGLRDALAAALDREDEQPTGKGASPVLSGGVIDIAHTEATADLLVETRLASAKARSFSPPTAIVRRHWQKKNSPEEALLEIFFGNVSVAKAAEVARILWGQEIGLGLLEEHARAAGERIRLWLQRRITAPQPYVFLQQVELRQKLKVESRSVHVLAAVGIGPEGARTVLAVECSVMTAGAPWPRLLADLKKRGLAGVELFIGANSPALIAAVAANFPRARSQPCLLQVRREVLALVPPAQTHLVMRSFEELLASGSEAESRAVAQTLAGALRSGRCTEAAARLDALLPHLFNYFRHPRAHWTRLHDTEPVKRVLNEFRERIRIIGPVADPGALTLMAGARLRFVSRTGWGRRRFFAFATDSRRAAALKVGG